MEGRGGVVGEKRRLHIIYFLCSKGCMDHPHLIRVHHLTSNGVFLRDIKRWLADLRGKGMPETFTWSYKRRYKKGFVWQDLLDDDLILKGSQMLSHSSFDPDPHSYLYAAENKSCLFKDLQPANSKAAAFQMHQNTDDIQITKTSFEMDQESPPHHNSGSTLIDACDAMNLQGDQKHSESTIEPNHEQSKDKSSENSCFYSNLLLKKKIKKKPSLAKDKDGEEMGCSNTSSSSSSAHSSSHQSQSQSQSQSVPLGKSKKRHLSMFRNLINCGAVDTDDAVFVRLNRDNKTYSRDNKLPNRSSQDIIICKKKRDQSDGGSARLFRTCMNQHHRPRQPQKHTTASKSDDKNRKTASANRPIGGPHCSHCRKQFKPEKLHSHMKSCIGMKALSKTVSASVVKMP